MIKHSNGTPNMATGTPTRQRRCELLCQIYPFLFYSCGIFVHMSVSIYYCVCLCVCMGLYLANIVVCVYVLPFLFAVPRAVKPGLQLCHPSRSPNQIFSPPQVSSGSLWEPGWNQLTRKCTVCSTRSPVYCLNLNTPHNTLSLTQNSLPHLYPTISSLSPPHTLFMLFSPSLMYQDSDLSFPSQTH